MAFGNVRGMGVWGTALMASVALHVVVLGTMLAMRGCGGSSSTTPPSVVPQTDGRADDLPSRMTDVQTADHSEGPSGQTLNDRLDKPQRPEGRKASETGKSTKFDRSKSDTRKQSVAKEEKPGTEVSTDGWKSYKVKSGDSLTKIARACGCSVPELAKANGLSATASLKLGQTLKVKDLPSDEE